VVRAGNQKITNKEQSPRVAELREELRLKTAARTLKAGAHATAILGLTLYRRTAPSPCYPAMFEPSLSVFVQGRKRITLAGTTYRCDESTFRTSIRTDQPRNPAKALPFTKQWLFSAWNRVGTEVEHYSELLVQAFV